MCNARCNTLVNERCDHQDNRRPLYSLLHSQEHLTKTLFRTHEHTRSTKLLHAIEQCMQAHQIHVHLPNQPQQLLDWLVKPAWAHTPHIIIIMLREADDLNVYSTASHDLYTFSLIFPLTLVSHSYRVHTVSWMYLWAFYTIQSCTHDCIYLMELVIVTFFKWG